MVCCNSQSSRSHGRALSLCNLQKWSALTPTYPQSSIVRTWFQAKATALVGGMHHQPQRNQTLHLNRAPERRCICADHDLWEVSGPFSWSREWQTHVCKLCPGGGPLAAADWPERTVKSLSAIREAEIESQPHSRGAYIEFTVLDQTAQNSPTGIFPLGRQQWWETGNCHKKDEQEKKVCLNAEVPLQNHFTVLQAEKEKETLTGK